jgi:alpha-tubulin suppressor-like RCC1 family protein
VRSPQEVVLRNATLSAVAGGSHFSLGLTTEGSVLAWGREYSGSFLTPVEGFKEKVIAIAAGGNLEKRNLSLALLAGGTVEAWGENECGQLGNGTRGGFSGAPVEVQGLEHVVAIAAGQNFGLALLSSGKVEAWGCNFSGQLGTGTNLPSTVPVEVQGLPGAVREISASAAGQFALARLVNGTVEAWGNNSSGQLGNNANGGESRTPLEVQGLGEPVTAIATGCCHSLALLANRTVESWGANFEGELGDNSKANRNTAGPVLGLSGVRAIAAGVSHSLALLTNGTVEAWGSNGVGELGTGTFGPETCPPVTYCSLLPVPTTGLVGVTAIAAGFQHSLALSPPAVTHVEPNQGSPSGGTTVTVTGTGFTAAMAVKFGSNSAASFTVNPGATSITAVSPPGTHTVDVTVTTPAGTSSTSAADRFAYEPPRWLINGKFILAKHEPAFMLGKSKWKTPCWERSPARTSRR